MSCSLSAHASCSSSAAEAGFPSQKKSLPKQVLTQHRCTMTCKSSAPALVVGAAKDMFTGVMEAAAVSSTAGLSALHAALLGHNVS